MAEDRAGTGRKPGKLCRLPVGLLPARLPVPAEAVLFPPQSCFQLFPKRDDFGQTAMCSHPGMETREGELAEKGQRWEKRRDSSSGGGAGLSGHGRAAAPRLDPGSWIPALAALGMRRLCPEERESVPRQRREMILFPRRR